MRRLVHRTLRRFTLIHARPIITQMKARACLPFVMVAAISVLSSSVHAQTAACQVWSRAENRCLKEAVMAAPLVRVPIRLGIQPISPAGVTAAQSIDNADLAQSPFTVAIQARGLSNPILMSQIETAPFFLSISTPFTRAASAAIQARRTFTQPIFQSIDALNRERVQLRVDPGSSLLTLDTIQGLVLKRGDQVIRPVASQILPTVVQNAMGAKRASANGVFTFDFSTFDPAQGALTVVMIGGRGNFDWEITQDDLYQLR